MKRISAALLATGLLIGLASGPLAQPTRAASLKICGDITVFVEPTATTSGLLTIGAVPLIVAAGANLPATVDVGADLCVDLSTNGLGQVTAANVSANVHAHLKVCGVVNAYTEATALATGLLRIGGTTFTTAVGSDLPASVDADANLCINLELDGFGRVSDGQVSANATSHVKVCGVVTALAEATATSTGSLSIADRTFKIAVGEDLPANVDVGADLCLDLTLNGFGQVSGTSAIVNVESTLDVCGKVTGFVDATSTSNGSLTIGGVQRTIAPGADVDADVETGAYLKIRLTVDAFGRISDASVLDVGASLAEVCGTSSAPTPSPEPSIAFDPEDPTASPAPSIIPEPSILAAPPTPQPDPSDPAAIDGPTCDDPGAFAGTGDGGTLLPDTDSLGRAATVVAGNAIPLIAIGLLGGLAAWFRSRRRDETDLGGDGAAAMRAEPMTDSDVLRATDVTTEERA